MDITWKYINKGKVMSILSDVEIKELCLVQENAMIYPYVDHQVRIKDGDKIISYGQSSYGYDIRLADEFKIFTNINSSIIDPLNFADNTYADYRGDYCIIPPNSYVLGRTIEVFNMPRDITGVCVGKSTYARCGVLINVTPIEAGFIGQVVIEISNSTPLPVKVYANMGIAQLLFFRGNVECLVSYADGNRKYQNQFGIQTALL
jgi:dCTP deaminase